MLRTHKINELGKDLAQKQVTICGWVDTIREHGSLIFIDLRDRSGKVQCVIHKSIEDFKIAKELSRESCIQIQGKVQERPSGTENKELGSCGEIEIGIEKLKIFNKAPILPYDIDKEDINEDLRLKYRFLDLRSKRMQKNLLFRSKLLNTIMNFFYKNNFVQIETPILAKSTPEGARDYLVPSRNVIGGFYALPQSPQLFKQLSQVAGFDRYIQIAKCFRDEDLRSDRQPEFTQIDLEMSFIEQEDIIEILEGMIKEVFKENLGIEIKTPFRRITYKESMEKYNTDRPDLRKETGEEFAFCWVVDFPLFEYSKEEDRFKATHHPFTKPSKNFEKEPKKATSFAYDMVLNGTELGGGSIRIHDKETQKKIFSLLKISEEEAQKKFGFLLSALEYGAPPHGGFAFGFDRICQLMLKEESIREIIAFPKNKEAKDVMLDAPSQISEQQKKDVHIKTIEPEKNSKKTKNL